MSKGKTQADAGINKRVSEPVYPADILSDSAVLACGIAVRGAWFWCLLTMWHEKRHKVSGTPETFGRAWGCSEDEADRIIGELRGNKVCRVRKSHSLVTLVSRRLKRRDKARLDAVKRKRAERAAAKRAAVSQGSHSVVAGKSPPPSVSVSVSSPVSTSGVPPTPLDDIPKPPASSTEAMALRNVITEYGAVTKQPIKDWHRKAWREWLEQYTDGVLCEAIRKYGKVGSKPWDIMDSFQKSKRSGNAAGAAKCKTCNAVGVSMIGRRCIPCYKKGTGDG